MVSFMFGKWSCHWESGKARIPIFRRARITRHGNRYDNNGKATKTMCRRRIELPVWLPACRQIFFSWNCVCGCVVSFTTGVPMLKHIAKQPNDLFYARYFQFRFQFHSSTSEWYWCLFCVVVIARTLLVIVRCRHLHWILLIQALKLIQWPIHAYSDWCAPFKMHNSHFVFFTLLLSDACRFHRLPQSRGNRMKREIKRWKIKLKQTIKNVNWFVGYWHAAQHALMNAQQ